MLFVDKRVTVGAFICLKGHPWYMSQEREREGRDRNMILETFQMGKRNSNGETTHTLLLKAASSPPFLNIQVGVFVTINDKSQHHLRDQLLYSFRFGITAG